MKRLGTCFEGIRAGSCEKTRQDQRRAAEHDLLCEYNKIKKIRNAFEPVHI